MQRPTAVTVFSILNMVFAALGFFGTIGSLVMLAALAHDTNNPMMEIIRDNPGYAMYMKVSALLGMAVGLALLAAGIGLWLLQPWGRLLSIAYGILAVISIPVNSVVSYLFVTRPLMEQMMQHHNNTAATSAAVGGMVGGLIGGCFGMIYPILLLVFMFRPNVAAAFKAPEAGVVPPDR
jgi:hypothetical protein